MRKVHLAVIGAGQRGNSYADYALKNPHEVEIVAVAEANGERRRKFQMRHNLCDEQCFTDWHELLAQPPLADAALICTQDRMHFDPAMAALHAGYHVLLEKPMSPDPLECVTMGECAAEYGRIFAICHVLRYTYFFSTLKQLLTEGSIGQLVSIVQNENVGFAHYGHSYVRGNWRNSTQSSPMILAKSCHDMDILLWMAESECVRIASFGSLTHFRPENAPEGAPQRCLDGCPVADSCAWYAPRLYLTENTHWPTSVISVDTSLEARLKAVREGPYGRCVYHCDNDVVDHQIVNIDFANGVTAAFSMCAFTHETSREVKLMGTKGEIRGNMEHNKIEVYDFASGTTREIHLHPQAGDDGHGGGDTGLIKDFTRLLRRVLEDGDQATQDSRTSATISVQSHLMAFAAERSRLGNHVIELADFQHEITRQ